MRLFEETDIERPFTVTVTRPLGNFGETGDYEESFETVVSGMKADIQLSLKVRRLLREDDRGTDDATVWVMYCAPPAPILSGDRVSDGTRGFVVQAVADWGSHTECVMERI